jgi:GNAT superfamily N-acetyltransferase
VSQSDDLEISTDRSRVDVELVHRFLSQESYWAQGRPREVVERTIAHSLCFGAYRQGQQLAFGRVVTDYAVMGYLADIFVVPAWRGQGVGKRLVAAMLSHPELETLQLILLRTRDAGAFYESLGFGPVPLPEELFARYRSG